MPQANAEDAAISTPVLCGSMKNRSGSSGTAKGLDIAADSVE
jgi:hypothetical protein